MGKDSWKDYFAFNRKQRNGILVLVVLISVMIIYLAISDYLPVSQKSVDFAPFKNQIKKAYSTDSSKISLSHLASANSHQPRPTDSSGRASAISHQLLDLNSADTAQLIALPGMTRRCAIMIFKYGKKLGGYYSVAQLKEVYAMDSAIYANISDKVSADRNELHKINLNTADAKKLGKHPYVGFKLAKTIINYREEHGKFKSVSDLKNIVSINDSLFLKIMPYFTIGNP